jgi:eukaryotic-like serine/threonine-protein kinase
MLVFMLLDYIEGATLHAENFRTRGHSLSQGFIILWKKSVYSGLNYAHNLSLIHCDIELGTIRTKQQGEVLLADFGITRMTDTATATIGGFGIAAYFAPELVWGQHPTPRSDIYSLGIVLYKMITGGPSENAPRSAAQPAKRYVGSRFTRHHPRWRLGHSVVSLGKGGGLVR